MRIKWKKRNRKTITKRCLITRLPYFFQLYILFALFFSSKITKLFVRYRTVSDHMADRISNQKKKSSSSTTEFNWGERIEIFVLFSLRFKSANEINPCNYCTTCTQQAYKWGNVLRHQQKLFSHMVHGWNQLH